MNDTSEKKNKNELPTEKLKIRKTEFNQKTIEWVRFGDIADVKVGLQTGDNNYYLYQNKEARGKYKDIEDYKQFLLEEDDLEKIRLKVIEKGIHKSKDEEEFDTETYFEGKYIVPYDKGGESDTKTGWLPNYFVPTNYFIDWSRESVVDRN